MRKPVPTVRTVMPLAAACAAIGLLSACSAEPEAEEEPEAAVVDYSTGETMTEAVDPDAIPVTLPETPETDTMVAVEEEEGEPTE